MIILRISFHLLLAVGFSTTLLLSTMTRTPDSLLPSSEPPDIKNWFSSYEYDSFVLETNDNFGFSESQCYENQDCLPKPRELQVTNDHHSEKENKCDNQVSDSPSLSPESEPPGVENWFSSYAYESPAPDTLDDLLCDHKESTVDCNEELQQQQEVENGSSKNSTELPPIHRAALNSPATSLEANENELPPIHSADLNSPATSLEANENGFVTVKSKREKLIRGNVKRAFTSSTNDSINGGDAKQVPMKRNTLSDVTNINAEHLSSVTGKWKCPRKSKPDTGPPLKQLRLGQWFHRQ